MDCGKNEDIIINVFYEVKSSAEVITILSKMPLFPDPTCFSQ